MRTFTAATVVTAVAMLLATPGHPQSKQPAESKPAAARPQTTAAQSGTKGIQRIESKEQFGQWKGSQLIGAKVEDPDGKNIGKIEDVMVDASGRVQFAILSFGGFLGVGDKWYAIPWNALQIERDREGMDVKRIVLDVTKETLERAPSFTKDRWPDTRDSQWTHDTQKFWSDTSITMAVKSKLAKEKASTLTKVNVDTHQGVVELKGTVDSSATKQRATELARQVDGVRRVVNNLKVEGS
jgi:sporulation protein YlmC with PRC-barrel domain